MGVPKFFRYTSERYPCLNELVKDYQIPDFDNMYLDMNGIIHNCSHPDDSNPHFRITEENIFKDIFHYISVLFQIIKPKKLFFMAIDGVAPRAKMNQQRGRRFRSAREAEQLEKQAKERGEDLPKEKRFDSNCITPGTVFMARLHEQLRYFVKNKITSDPMWANCKIVLSGHETPGEGEHKIMDYIRWARSQSDYDPNTRHCLYGLDADLIMLGMCTHELHFALLREEVKFGRTNQKATTPEETNFYLLHLSLLREYLEQEFILIKDNLPFEYDLEKIIDDWVLMGFLVGNDFIPHLPNMHIHNDAFPLLCKTYMTVLPLLNGYINEAGTLNLERFEKFMQELAKVDKEAFQETYTDLKYFEAKTGRRPNMHERKSYKPKDDETFNVDVNEIKANSNDKSDLEALIAATDELLEVDEADIEDDEYDDLYETETSDDDANFNMEFDLHKRDYYMNKLDYAKVTSEVLQSQAECYVRAIQWNLYYYYKGCPSWCWFYPHHYAPYISDIKGFKDLKIEFELGEPFKPFEQLLAVLPAASMNLLPEPFHKLMVSETSPIFTYYPINFDTDLNGKKNDWEAVVLIPFIDENNLLSAMGPCYALLTAEEKQRNTHGPMFFYSRTTENQGECKAPEYFPTIKECYAKETPVFREEIILSNSQLIQGVLPKATRNLFYPGFPTMRHLKYKSSVQKNKVKVFDQPSRGFNMIIEIVFDPKLEPSLEVTADELLGKVVWVGWPHLVRAKVLSVSNKNRRLHYTGVGEDSVVNCNLKLNVSEEANVGNMAKQWNMERSVIIEHNNGRLGINLGEVTTIVHAVNMQGYKYQISKEAAFVVEPVWCSVSCGYSLQSVVRDIHAHTIDVLTRYSTAEEAFKPDDIVFLMTETYYGCMAKVVTSSQAVRSGRVKVSLTECQEPTISINQLDRASYYFPAHHAAARCGIRPQILSRITGIVFIVLGYNTGMEAFDSVSKINIGLNLKFNKKNEEVTGYTRRCPVSNMWLYSQKCVEVVGAYARQFPDVFDHLIANSGADMFEADLFPNNVGEGKPQEIVEWLKKQGHSKAVKRGCGSEMLESDELNEVHYSIQKQLKNVDNNEKKLTLQVKINLLYKPDLHHGQLVPDSKANFQLYDRVVNINNMITVPLGLKGTITGIYNSSTINTVRLSDKLNLQTMYQVMFDEEFTGGLSQEPVQGQQFYKLPASSLLNISYGRKLRNPSETSNPSAMSFTGQRPNVLRTGDGHNSAFASFTGQKKIEPVKLTPSYKNSEQIQTSNETPTKSHDTSTELLKALLKISIDTPPKDSPPQQKKPFPRVPLVPQQDMHWRQREAPGARHIHSSEQSYPQNSNWANNQNYKNNNGFKKGPNTNWRQNQHNDSAARRTDIQPEQNEWKPTILQNPNNHQGTLNFNRPTEASINPPMPPFPTFARDRIPMPNFKNNMNLGFHSPQQQQQTLVIHNSNFNNEAPIPNRYSQGCDSSLEGFPKHLPDVENDQAGASRSFSRAISQISKNMGSTEPQGFQRQQSLDKMTVTQMVPLQVVASQRRVQKNGDREKKTVEVNQSTPLTTDNSPNQKTQTTFLQETSNENKVSQKQKRKKKLRIAANLPNLNLE